MIEILNRFLAAIGNWVLNRKLKKSNRERQVINLDEAKSIAILYEVTNEKRFNIIKDLSKKLSTNNRQVMILGFVDQKKSIPDYCVAANAGYYFNRSELNWYGGPKADYLEQFIQKPFEILIDLTVSDKFINRYIAALSKSRFKVGLFSDKAQKYLDLMIESDPDKSFVNYVDQTLHYLKILKSK